jgi:hypothetical protein
VRPVATIARDRTRCRRQSGASWPTITDFSSFVAAAKIRGTAQDNDRSTYNLHADVRFMTGRYVASEGRLREAPLGFA